jgi:hypothetical protein
MQTQSQRFIKWVPKRETFVQKNIKKADDEHFLKSIAAKRLGKNEKTPKK